MRRNILQYLKHGILDFESTYVSSTQNINVKNRISYEENIYGNWNGSFFRSL